MNNKKNKKQRGGFVDMTNPMMIIFGIISVICLIYGVLVYFYGSFNPMDWFGSETGKTLPTMDLFRSDSAADPLGIQPEPPTLEAKDVPIPKPKTNPDLWKGGGKLLKKFRRK